VRCFSRELRRSSGPLVGEMEVVSMFSVADIVILALFFVLLVCISES
jgi:hypothetical protein